MTDNIAAVITYIDDEQTMPADYVVQLYPGLFEARCLDEHAAGYERVLGVFVSVRAASRAIWKEREPHYPSFCNADWIDWSQFPDPPEDDAC
jgi:hypothetical protein